MKSKFFGTILGLALSIQGVEGMPLNDRQRPIDLGQEFTKSSNDADVVIQQAGSDLSVILENKENHSRIHQTISLNDVITGLLAELKKQVEEGYDSHQQLEQIENDLEQKNDEIRRTDNEIYDKQWAGPAKDDEEKQQRNIQIEQLKSEKKQAECVRQDIYGSFLSNFSQQIFPISFELNGCGISSVELFQNTVRFDLSIDNSINIRCYVDFNDPRWYLPSDNQLYTWHTVVFNTNYDGKLAIETDYVDIYNAKVKDIVAHSNKDVMVSFDQLFAERIKLLSYFNLAYCTLDQVDNIWQPRLNEINPEGDIDLKRAFDQSLEVRKNLIRPWGVLRRGFYCAKDGVIQGKNVQTTGFDEVVLAGTVNVDNWYSDAGVRLGPDLESRLDPNMSLANWPNAITINTYLSAPWLSVNTLSHSSKKSWDYLTDDGRIAIKQLDPITKKNVIDIWSQQYMSGRDRTDASQDQKNIRKILSNIDEEDDYESLSFIDNNNLIDFLVEIVKPPFVEGLKLIGLSPKQVPNQIFKTTLQVTDKNTGATDNVTAVAIDVVRYFYSPQRGMYNNYKARYVLDQSIKDLSIVFKTLKKLLKDLGISIDDVINALILVEHMPDILQISNLLSDLKENVNLSEVQDQNQFNEKVNDIKKMLREMAGYSDQELNGMSFEDILKIDVDSQEFRIKVIKAQKKKIMDKVCKDMIEKINEAKEHPNDSDSAVEEEEEKAESLKGLQFMSFLSDHGYKVDKISDINTENSDFQIALNEFAKYGFILSKSNIFSIHEKPDVNLINLMSSKFSSSEQNH